MSSCCNVAARQDMQCAGEGKDCVVELKCQEGVPSSQKKVGGERAAVA